MPRYRLLILVVLAAGVGTAFMGSRGLYEPTEARYAEVAREMLDSGDYIHPTLSGQLHYTKPPVAYWTIAAGMKILGIGTWGARLGNMIAFLLTVLIVSEIGTIVWGERAGLIVGLVYSSSLLPLIGSTMLNADTVLTLWVTATMLAFVKAWGERRAGIRRWWIRLMWVSLALGFMTKGPPALLPLAVIIVFRFVGRRKMGLADPLGLALFFGIGFWWYILIVVEQPGMLKRFIGEEIIARNLTASAERNPQWYAPFTIYLPTLLFGALPWIYFALRRPGTIFFRSGPKEWKHIFRDIEGLITFWWFAIPLIIFCFSRSRLPLYLLQVFPPLALWLASNILRCKITDRKILAIAVTSLLIFSAAKGIIAHVPVGVDSGQLYAKVMQAGGSGTSILTVENPGHHGLEFYSRGKAMRISIGSRAPWADETLEGIIDRISEGKAARNFTFVVDQSLAGAVQAKLAESHVHYDFEEEIHRKVIFGYKSDSKENGAVPERPNQGPEAGFRVILLNKDS